MNFTSRSGERLHSAAAWALMIGTVTLAWREGHISSGVPKISEVFLAAAITVTAFIFLLKMHDKAVWAGIRPLLIRCARSLMAIFLGICAGYVFSMLFLPDWRLYLGQSILEFGRIGFVFLLFFTSAYLASSRPAFMPRLLLGISASPLILWLALVPQWADRFVKEGRLHGPGDPNYLAMWMGLGLIISLCFFLYGRSRWRGAGLGLFALILPLVLWTGSRGAWLATTVAGSALLAQYLWQKRRAAIGGIAAVLAATAIAGMLTFSTLPPDSHTMLAHRLVEPITAQRPAAAGQARGELFAEGVRMVMQNPLGFGPAYHHWRPVMTLPDGRLQGPHNLFLEVALTGGVLALGGFLAFLRLFASRGIRLIPTDDFLTSAIVFGSAAQLINALFLDTFTLRWLWILLGFFLAVVALPGGAAQDGRGQVNRSPRPFGGHFAYEAQEHRANSAKK